MDFTQSLIPPLGNRRNRNKNTNPPPPHPSSPGPDTLAAREGQNLENLAKLARPSREIPRSREASRETSRGRLLAAGG